MTDDHAAFMKAIIERPDDDLPRLVYADWLDERGEAKRAEFIRLQCVMARDPTSRHIPQMRRRERELLEQRHPFQSSVAAASYAWLPLPVRFAHDHWHESSVRPTPPVFHRGFVESITCSWQDWRRYADDIVAATPLRTVRLTRPRLSVALIDDMQKSLANSYPGITFELPYSHTAGGTDPMRWAVDAG